MANNSKWVWLPRSKHFEEKILAARTGALSHPLRISVSRTVNAGVRTTEVAEAADGEKKEPSLGSTGPKKISLANGMIMIDPLSALALEKRHIPNFIEEPLSKLSGKTGLDQSALSMSNGLISSDDSKDSVPSLLISTTFEPWQRRRLDILQKHTTNERLSIVTSFLPGGHLLTASPLTVSEKARHRLDQLDFFEQSSVRQMQDLSQADFTEKLNDLNETLLTAWNQDQRVLSIKIVIQCAKLLSDKSVPHFYPSKFVLVSDVLDTLGRLVYDRLWNKANADRRALGSLVPLSLTDFKPQDIPDTCKETCRNWFYKVASIRELLPRLYVEVAILRSNKFLYKIDDSKADLLRLVKMCRGIGDPLVAVYARAYVCRVAAEVLPGFTDAAELAFNDFLVSFEKMPASNSLANSLENLKISYDKFIYLFNPALQWILACATGSLANSQKADSTLINNLLLEKIFRQCTNSSQPLLLNCMLASFPAVFVSEKAQTIIALIKQATDLAKVARSKHSVDATFLLSQRSTLLRLLGESLLKSEPFLDDKLRLLNDVWKLIMRLPSVVDYLECAQVWIEYAAKYFSTFEVNTLLGDIIDHVLPEKAYEQCGAALKSILERILSHQHNFQELLSMDKFAVFLDLFTGESVRVICARTLLESFLLYQGQFPVAGQSDILLSNHIMTLCKTVHDSLTALSLEDEFRAVSQIINHAIDAFDFGLDFEHQLEFFCDARGYFSNLDPVIAHLIRKVNLLANATREVVRMHHTRRTAGFVRACSAFSFISIPSLSNIFDKLALYLESASVALVNQSLPQADAMLKSAISLLPEVPSYRKMSQKQFSNEPKIVETIGALLSFLLVVPDSPESGMLYLFNGLLNAIDKIKWPEGGDGRAAVLMQCLAWLSSASQPEYAYSIPGIVSNDKLYGGDAKFLSELQLTATGVLAKLFAHLKELGSSGAYKRQSHICLNLFDCILHHGDLASESMQTLALNLWGLAQRHKEADTVRLAKVFAYVKSKAESCVEQDRAVLFRNLYDEMSQVRIVK